MLQRALKYHTSAAVVLALLAGASSGAVGAPIVDSKTPSSVTNVSREQLENLPTGRRLEDLIRTCPAQTIPTITTRPQTLIDGIPTSPSPSPNCIQPDDLRMIEVYKAHNAVRAEYGVTPLQWNPVLAGNAQTHANRLAQIGQLVHASREGRGTERENISQGLPSWNANQLMGSWLSERQFFTPGIFPNVSTTGDWYQIGHYSQMIWPTTTDIGCGMATGSGFSWLVCRYDPGGNKDGKPVGQMQTQQVAQQGQEILTENERAALDYFLSTGSFAKDGGGTAADAAGIGGRRTSLFDFGIYSGGAWTTDWFDIDYAHLGGQQSVLYFLSTESFGDECVAPPLSDYAYYHLVTSFYVDSEFRTDVGNLLDTPPPDSFDRLGSFESPREFFLGCKLRF